MHGSISVALLAAAVAAMAASGSARGAGTALLKIINENSDVVRRDPDGGPTAQLACFGEFFMQNGRQLLAYNRTTERSRVLVETPTPMAFYCVRGVHLYYALEPAADTMYELQLNISNAQPRALPPPAFAGGRQKYTSCSRMVWWDDPFGQRMAYLAASVVVRGVDGAPDVGGGIILTQPQNASFADWVSLVFGTFPDMDWHDVRQMADQVEFGQALLHLTTAAGVWRVPDQSNQVQRIFDATEHGGAYGVDTILTRFGITGFTTAKKLWFMRSINEAPVVEYSLPPSSPFTLGGACGGLNDGVYVVAKNN